MKKIFSFLATILLAVGFTACEDIPAPYEINDQISGDGAKTLPFVQSFEASLGGYKSYTVSGEGRWINDHKAAVASGYNSATQTTTAGCFILVSPEITLEGQENAHLVMEYTLRYLQRQADQKVMITKVFDENKPGEGWTDIPVELEEVGSWEESKTIDIQIPEEFMGARVRLALYYNTNAQRGSSWQVKSLALLKGLADNEGGEDKPQPEAGAQELPYAEAFNGNLGVFQNYTTEGSGEWMADSRGFAKASGFTAENQPAVQGTYFLVSPEIVLVGKKEAHVSYEYINSFNDNPKNHQMMINAAFDANNPAEGWVSLNANHEKTISWTDWKKADIQIPAEYMGKNVRIAFRYECKSDRASTFEVKNFKAEEGKAGGNTPDVKPEGDAIFSADLSADEGGFVSFVGTNEWKWGVDTKFGCAKVSGHVGGKEGHKVPGVAYYVSPEISLENVAQAHLSYTYAIGYMSLPEYHKVLVNANFDEANPETGWVELETTHKYEDKKFAWFDNDIQLPAEMMGKKVRIGFRYECDAEKASTWEVKNVKVVQGKSEGGNEGGGNEGGGTPDAGDVTASNGDFEAWVGGAPNNWKSASTASKGDLSQSEDAHSGKFSVRVEGNDKYNMRLAYKELNLKAGSYTMTFYTKAATADGGSVRPGFVPVEGGAVGSYVYGEYVNDLSNSEWTKVEHSFDIAGDGTYCLVIMNAKRPGKDILIDDFTLTDGNGNAIIK